MSISDLRADLMGRVGTHARGRTSRYLTLSQTVVLHRNEGKYFGVAGMAPTHVHAVHEAVPEEKSPKYVNQPLNR